MRWLVLAGLLAGAARAEDAAQPRRTIVELELAGRGLVSSLAVEHSFSQYLGAGIGFGVGVFPVPCLFGSCAGPLLSVPAFLTLAPFGDALGLYLSAGGAFLHNSGGAGLNFSFSSGGKAIHFDPGGSEILATFQLGYQFKLRNGLVIRPTADLIIAP